MKLLRARLGVATNSSSTHSIILASNKLTYKPQGNSEFGWEWFQQRSADEKRAYMSAQLYGQLRNQVGEAVASAACKSIFGIFESEGYVDHQSEITCPVDAEGNMLVDFYRELAEDLIQDKTVHIRGGNDNGDAPAGSGDDHPRWGFLRALIERPQGKLVARKNKDGVWTLFDRYDGTKLHLTFGDLDKSPEQENYRPPRPELVDVKITDYCPFGCDYCYQDSTKEGKDAPIRELQSLAYDLSCDGVFEVALGGGEPTLHRDFPAVIRAFAEQGIVVNFTTKSRHWYRHPDIVEAVMAHCGGYGVSVDHAHFVQEFVTLHEAMLAHHDGKVHYTDRPKLSFHYILDNGTMKDFEEMLKKVPSGYTLLLLGYKSVGRGGKKKHHNKGWLKKVITLSKNNSLPSIAIDTALANQYKDELVAEGINERLYYKEEGRFSMYIDAVAKEYGKSSYDGQLYKFQHGGSALKAFAAWN